MSQNSDLSIYSDEMREGKSAGKKENRYSKYCDLIYYESSVTPGFLMAMLVYKPAKPAHIVATTHGWHMSIPKFEALEEAPKYDELWVHVDMRGRAFSEGKQDCNGYELHDVIDAVEYVKAHYAAYISDPDVVYYEGGSGAGGNGYEILNKFPDYFAAASAYFGISDYARWYQDDGAIGEFRDEMDVWVGCTPDENPMAYQARSGLHGLENLHTPLVISHGETDVRVQVCQARLYAEKAKAIGKGDLVQYYELAGVGTRDHTGNITPEQRETMERLTRENRAAHTVPITLPASGRLWVHGYLVTKRFSVWLDSIDKVAALTYDLDAGSFEISCPVPVRARIEVK